ncbi:MAG: bacteriohemerythrin [Gammaproteobacteria bacterium]|nr:bacteriohemerythrin [Gammaproteobacteria bacterium]
MLGRKRTTVVEGAHCLLKDVGVNAINRQHLRLASYAVEFNQIVDELSGREPTNEDWRRFDALFSKVRRYVQTHFQEEEALMQAHGYPDFAAHKRLHDDFVKQLIDVQSKINDRRVEFKDRFGVMLWNWLKHHINEEDYKYREFFRAEGLE